MNTVPEPARTFDDVGTVATQPPAQTVTDVRQEPSARLVNLRPAPQITPLDEIEKTALIEALKACNWVQVKAAEMLDITPRVMNYKLKIHGIDVPRRSRPAAI